MDDYQQEIRQIQQILRDNPKGMTVTDISRKIKINRNSVAKYLDIMRISGLVEMITFGPAKVFFPSCRVPIIRMLNYTSDYIVVFDQDLKITMINDAFLEFVKIVREEILGQTINNTILTIFSENVDISVGINEAIGGKTFTKDVSFKMEDEDIHFQVRIVPTTFEDSSYGVTLIITNKTGHKIVEDALRESEKNFRILLEKVNKR
jgi:PAS domain-containing protein